MDELALSNAQQHVVDSTNPRICFFGPRQVGLTTGLAADAIMRASNGERVGVSGPTHRQQLSILETVRSIVDRQDLNIYTQSNTQVTFSNGGQINAISNSSFGNNRSTVWDDYDHISIDNADCFWEDFLDECTKKSISEKTSVLLVGTARTDSEIIKPAVTDNEYWYSVYDSGYSVRNSEHISGMQESLSSEQELIEINGYFVSDPAEDADFVVE